jgi:hypothetical protein
LTDGKLYRIGVHNATAEQMEKIPLLIKEINLEALSNIQ